MLVDGGFVLVCGSNVLRSRNHVDIGVDVVNLRAKIIDNQAMSMLQNVVVTTYSKLWLC